MKPFWKHSAELGACLARERLLLTLDFDGKLAALAETPRMARLRPEYRAALKALASRRGVNVFILSGRALGDLRRLVGLPGLYYGGNHGIELKGPGFARRDAGAARLKARIGAVAAELLERFPPGTGVLVEDKGFSASVHYRALKAHYRAGFFRRMRALTRAADRDFRWSRGHKVFELRPLAAPNKGDAALLLARRLKASCVLAAGDDLTDEDMFRALSGRGITVRVGRRARSAAEFFLGSQAEVLRLLKFVTAARRAA